MVAMTSHISHPAFGMQTYPQFLEILVLFQPPKNNIDSPRYDISGLWLKIQHSISAATLDHPSPGKVLSAAAAQDDDELHDEIDIKSM